MDDRLDFDIKLPDGLLDNIKDVNTTLTIEHIQNVLSELLNSELEHKPKDVDFPIIDHIDLFKDVSCVPSSYHNHTISMDFSSEWTPISGISEDEKDRIKDSKEQKETMEKLKII